MAVRARVAVRERRREGCEGEHPKEHAPRSSSRVRRGQPSERSRRKKAAAAGAAAACDAAKRVSASASASGWTPLRTAWWVDGWVDEGWAMRGISSKRQAAAASKRVGWMGRAMLGPRYLRRAWTVAASCR